MRAGIRHLKWVRFLSTALALLALAGGSLRPAMATAPAHGRLRLSSLHPAELSLCLGDTQTLDVMVTDAGAPIPSLWVAGVTLAVQTGLGAPQVIRTDARGDATWQVRPSQVGEMLVRVTASKPGYLPSDPLTMRLVTQACAWDVDLAYREYFAPASTPGYRYSGRLSLRATLVAGADGQLSLPAGTAPAVLTYALEVSGPAEADECRIEPDAAGTVVVALEGHLEEGTLNLVQAAPEITLPETARVVCRASSASGWETRPAAVPLHAQVSPLTSLSLRELSVPVSGGAFGLASAGGLFWSFPAAQFAAGQLVITRGGP